jgi:hypothetical protein
MDFASIFARVGSGFAVRLIACAFAVYAVCEAYSYVSTVFEGVSNVLR